MPRFLMTVAAGRKQQGKDFSECALTLTKVGLRDHR